MARSLIRVDFAQRGTARAIAWRSPGCTPSGWHAGSTSSPSKVRNGR